MAQYTCRVYFNTGFNSINIPDSPALLNQMSYADAAALDINQERFMPSVRIKTDWNTVKNGDYCKLGDFFYFIRDMWMTSGDVCELTLVPDFITSAGGTAALTILDGITSRVHVSDDTYGLYCEEDPLMFPAETLDISFDISSGDFSSYSTYTFLESDIDLFKLGNYDAGTMPGVTAIDQTDPTAYYVTWPEVPYRSPDQGTVYTINAGGSSVNISRKDGFTLFELNHSGATANKNIYQAGIGRARSLGIEQSISGQFQIPSVFLNTPSYFTGGIMVDSLSNRPDIKTISGLPFVYGTANNNRLFYGSQTPYTLYTCAGNSVMANAEEIYTTATLGPRVYMYADPRRSGKPFYRFNDWKGQAASGSKGLAMVGAVAGAEWRSVPLIFTEKSGNLLDRINYNASQQKADMTFHHGVSRFNDQLSQNTESIGRSIGTAIGGTMLSGETGGMYGGLTAAMATAENRKYIQGNRSDYIAEYALQKAIDTQAFQISQSVTVPDVQFAVEPDFMTEALGNGYIVSRLKYTANDITRIDKILTAYGYKHTKVLETSDFTNRTRFNYVESSITVGNLPTWWAEGIAAQFGNGVRIWHVKPDPSYYTTGNPIVGGA